VATLRAATVRRKRAETNLKAARRSESHAALDAVLAGVTQADVARITGYTREHVRRITDAARAERESVPSRQRPERPTDWTELIMSDLAEMAYDDNSAEIDTLTETLVADVAAAQRSTFAAISSHDRLCSPQVYAIEFAEGRDDIAHHLQVARRSLNAARALIEEAERAQRPDPREDWPAMAAPIVTEEPFDDPRTEETDCIHCGMSDWDCLDGINRVHGRHCCGMCGLTPAHEAGPLP
jgi:hypothetical protein